VKSTRFTSELIEGHKSITAVVVPFDPETTWNTKPTRLAGRRHGWPITGTINGVRFAGYVGERWNRFFITIDARLRGEAKARVGQPATLVIKPSTSAEVLALAIEQSKVTTQPKTARPDAVVPDI
jgi:hypothetical protein